jgi:hypothetical protein
MQRWEHVLGLSAAKGMELGHDERAKCLRCSILQQGLMIGVVDHSDIAGAVLVSTLDWIDCLVH